MAFISLMHWHAIGTLEQATIMIRRFRPSLRSYVQIGLRHGLLYDITPVHLQAYSRERRLQGRWYKMVSAGLNAKISIDWRHWKIESPGLTGTWSSRSHSSNTCSRSAFWIGFLYGLPCITSHPIFYFIRKHFKQAFRSIFLPSCKDLIQYLLPC